MQTLTSRGAWRQALSRLLSPGKRRYFYGLRVHLVVTKAGEPVEFALSAASEADLAVFKELDLELGEGAIICADKAYTDYAHEDFLEEVGLHLKSQRKNNSRRPMPAFEEFLGKPVRQYIETVFSELSEMFARKIHAVTPRGFELKIVCALVAFSVQCLLEATRLNIAHNSPDSRAKRLPLSDTTNTM